MINNIFFKLRSIFFSPDSNLELWLRTKYHRLNQTRVFFILQDWLAERSYRRWRKYQNKQPLADVDTFEYQPKVSFVITSHSNPEDLAKTIETIRNLEGDNWEILLVSEVENDQVAVKEELLKDDQVKIIQYRSFFSPNSINGDFLIICQAGDQFLKGFLVNFYSSLSYNNSADWYYFDSEYVDDQTGEITPLFKPQSLSPALLLSVNYMSRGFIRSSFVAENQLSSQSIDNLLNLEYELALRLCENNGSVEHIPHVLVRQNQLVNPDTPEIQRIVQTYLSHTGLKDVSSQTTPYGTRFTWQTGDPSVAIIVPTKNNKPLLEKCINSIWRLTSYKNFNIHLVDNDSTDPETLDYYKKLKSEPRIKIHPYPAEFNYSKAVNLGVAQSDSELVLLLNDDMEIFDPDWMTELVQWAIRPEIGVVGGKLIRANHTIQHVGIIIGLHGFAGHIYLNASEHYQGLFGSVDWYRDYQALTGACQMMRREVFNQVGGYDEGYKIAFGDIDFCLRVQQAGYRTIYTPFARLFHYEGSSRGYVTPQGDVLRGYTKMRDALIEEDPYFSPNLSYTRVPKCVLSEQTSEEREKIIEIRKMFYEKKS